MKRLGVELGAIYVKVSRNLSYETDEVSQYQYSFMTSLMMLRKDETVGTYATGGKASLRSKWTSPGNSKMNTIKT